MFQTTLRTKPSFYFEANKTYLIGGGLGGLGRSIALWMVSRGARNLILLSRSGVRNQKTTAFLRMLEAEGARVEAPACDMADASALKLVLDHCAETMPPVMGCIQASMVLRVSQLPFPVYESICSTPNRMLYSRICPTKIGEQVLTQRHIVRGTFTSFCQRTWNFSSSFPPSVA